LKGNDLGLEHLIHMYWFSLFVLISNNFVTTHLYILKEIDMLILKHITKLK